MNKLIYTFLIIIISLFTANGQIVINEYSAANYNTSTDNYGEFEDWVELYNPTATAIDINGWALTDKPSNTTKWLFPSSFILPANGVAIIYCSGRNELIGANAHANFKITQTKGSEVLMLSDAGGIFQDSIRVLPNQKSHTRGRETDGSLVWSVFTTGTPNASNVGALQEYTTTPIFSQTGGYNSGAVNLTLSSPDPNTTIYYTTNGDEPNNTSTQYTGIAINITTTSVVKAISYSSNANIPSSFIDFHTFFINDIHTIPILSVSGTQVDDLLSGFPFSNLEPEGTIEWFDENGILLDKGTGEYNKHGNDSWAYNQRGFDYVMRDQFGYNYALQDKIFATKSRDKFQRVIVKAAANDNYPFSYGGSGAHIRDAYVHHLSQLADLRMDERSTSSCILYRNGEYWGVYEMREKVDDHDFTDYYYDQDKNNLQYLKTWGGTWTEYGAPNAQPDWNNFVNFVATNPMVSQVNYNQAKSEYNTGSLIDYFLLNAYVVCQDWLNWNTAWWRGMDPNGDKKKWRYTLWDMDNTFDHGTNYTGIPSSDPAASPCDPSTLGNTGGQGHVPIWNEMLTNEEFHDEYINRWQDLANGPLSCTFMVNLLDSMIAVIEPEMTRQITTWGGTYAGWQNNVTTLRNFILARCDSMNSGFVDCDPEITGPYDVTVEIIGIGEVEMSTGNLINQNNTGWTDQRFGGIALPFEVKSGSFDHWEVISANAYIYDQNVDTLLLDLQGDVIVRAYFIPTKNITYNVIPEGTVTTMIVDGIVINTFPTSINYMIDDTVNISPNIDPLYGFSTWSSDSVTLMPLAANMTDSFYASNDDTVTLHIYKKPTIIYDINPTGTTTSISINGNIISSFPYSETVFIDDLNTIIPSVDPQFVFSSWRIDSNTLLNGVESNNSFYGEFNDSVILNIYKMNAFINGNDTICDNAKIRAQVKVYFDNAIAPYTFSYSINGAIQPSITSANNPYIINTKEEGNYVLTDFSDANSNGAIIGSARVTILESPIANFLQPDSMTILYTSTRMINKSLEGDTNISSWNWNFGDNTPLSNDTNPFHTYPESIDLYQVSLIINDNNGCSDTTFKQVQITDDYWMYIPNSFTPDLDGINDRFCISYNGVREGTFTFNVYSRFSELVYSTNNIHELDCENGWDGKHQISGIDLPFGAYIYQMYYQDFDGWKHQESSEIIIIR
jgi:gliding motility-associated-like protein